MTIGERIKEKRLEKEMSLRELARRAHVSHSFLADIEAGRSMPSVQTLQGIAESLGTTISYLMGETPAAATQAAHRTDDYDNELPEEAKKELESYKEYLRQKYRKK